MSLIKSEVRSLAAKFCIAGYIDCADCFFYEVKIRQIMDFDL